MTRCPGLLGLTLQAPGCATRSGRAAAPLCRSVQWEAVIRPRRSISLHSTPRHSLPFADGSFDVVFSCFSPSPWDEFCRVLRPGGALPTSLHLAPPLHRCTAVPPHRCTHPPLHSYSLSTARHTSAQLARLCTPAHPLQARSLSCAPARPICKSCARARAPTGLGRRVSPRNSARASPRSTRGSAQRKFSAAQHARSRVALLAVAEWLARLQREAPSRSRWAALWAPEQRYARVAPAVRPSSLSEAPPQTLTSLRLVIQVASSPRAYSA